jgi:hypothetical protein
VVTALRSLRHTNTEIVEKIRSEAEYFEKNAERMRYPKFRRQHLFVGSGVIEAGYGDWRTTQAIRHVLDRPRGQCNPGAPLLPSQRTVRGLLGGSPGGLISTYMSHTPLVSSRYWVAYWRYVNC